MVLLADEDPFDDEDEREVEPAADEYLTACADLKCVKCSQWQRACISRATEVVLCHYGLGKRGVEPLTRSLVLNTHLKSLDLGDNGLGAEGVTTVLSALHTASVAPSLRVLSLRQNQAGEDGAEALRALLASGGGHPITTIDFGSNAIGTKGGETVAEGLLTAAESGGTCIASLSLENNEIDSVERLAAALKSSPTLTALSLEWNQLGPSGGKALADALTQQPPLVTLNVGWNGLGDEGVRHIAHAIEMTPVDGPLRDVRLHHNRMTVDASVPLSRALGALDFLDVSGNALGEAGAAVLLIAQQELRLRAAPDADADAEGDVEPSRCHLVMEDVCVMPDTMLAGLLQRAAKGEALSHDELERGRVLSAAAPALAAAAPPKPTRGRSAGKGKAGSAAEGKKWMRNDEPEPAAKGKTSARKAK